MVRSVQEKRLKRGKIAERLAVLIPGSSGRAVGGATIDAPVSMGRIRRGRADHGGLAGLTNRLFANADRRQLDDRTFRGSFGDFHR